MATYDGINNDPVFNTVTIKGGGINKEAPAGASILPGHLLKLNSSGQVIPHNVAGGAASKAIAIENELGGGSYGAGYNSGKLTTAYASGDNVPYVIFDEGSEVNALVAAGAAAIVIGDFLESAGDGTFRKYVPITSAAGVVAAGTVDVGASFSQATLNANFASVDAFISKEAGHVRAIALQALDNSAGATVARLIVEVL